MMLRALAIKELRETGLWALAALFAYAYVVAAATGFQMPGFSNWEKPIPFLGGPFLVGFGWVTAALAIALGFRQSAWESMRQTYLFLLHRPAPWWLVFGVKLAIGMALLLLSAALPVLLYAWWAATPGTHASPFEWSMTWPAWKWWAAMSMLYQAAFLSGLRPGHWLGSRLWPLAAAGLLTVAVQFLPFWPLLGIATVLLVNAWLAVLILTVAHHREYA